jgi:hypothetical protein
MEEKRWKTSENNWKIDENCWKNNEKASNPIPNQKKNKKKHKTNCLLNSAPRPNSSINYEIKITCF